MHPTKGKILHAALELFNEFGLANVRLQQIADRTGISVGNLAYHFCDKKAIVSAIHRELKKETDPILSLRSEAVHLIDFDNQLSTFYFLSKKYAFYFLDVLELERAYPALHGGRKIYIDSIINQIHHWLLMQVQLETLQREKFSNQYQTTAHTLWILTTFWLTQLQVRGINEDEVSFKRSIWYQIAPHLTDKGILEFQALIEPQLQALVVDY